MPFFRVNQEGIRVVDCEIKHVSEIKPGIREMIYPVPSDDIHANFFNINSTMITTSYETDYCHYILELKLYMTEEKLRQFLDSQYDNLKIRDKTVKDCDIKELLFAANKKLGD